MKTVTATATLKFRAGTYRLKVVARFPGGLVKKGKKHVESKKLKKLALRKVEL